MDSPIKEFDRFLPEINNYLLNDKYIKIIHSYDWDNYEVWLYQKGFFIKSLKIEDKQQIWYYILGMRDLLRFNR